MTISKEEFEDIVTCDQLAGLGCEIFPTDLILHALSNHELTLGRSLYKVQAMATLQWANRMLDAYRAAERSGNYSHRRRISPIVGAQYGAGSGDDQALKRKSRC